MKLSPTSLILFAILLSVFTLSFVYEMIQVTESGYGYALVAEKLTQKPETYFTLFDPDPYALEAIRNPQKPVFVDPATRAEFFQLWVWCPALIVGATFITGLLSAL